MTDRYTAQMLRGGMTRNGQLRAGFLICGVSDCGRYAWPVQYIEDPQGWVEVFKRYPIAQVTRLPDLDVQFREIKHYRNWEKARQEA